MLDHNTEEKNKFFNPGGCLRCELMDHMVIQGYECFPQCVCLSENHKDREWFTMYVCNGVLHQRCFYFFHFITFISFRSLNGRSRSIFASAGESLKPSTHTLQNIKLINTFINNCSVATSQQSNSSGVHTGVNFEPTEK